MFYWFNITICLDIEDEENWHGKAIGAKAEEAINVINSLISDSDVPVPQEIVNDAPEVSISGIHLSEPPSYKLGEKVN